VRTQRRNTGFTLIELLVVLAILVLLAVMVAPSFRSLSGSTRQKAAADAIRGELAAARAWAMEDGEPYRVALSTDGTRMRRAPEGTFAQAAVIQDGSVSARSVEYTFEHATAEIEVGADQQTPSSTDGWLTIAVILPDGTCRDDGSGATNLIVAVREIFETGTKSAPLKLAIRGITGSSRVLPSSQQTGGQQ
jgi:type II secretion system protein H